MTDQALVTRLAEGCDCIIHTAAMHGSSRGKKSNAEFLQTNIMGAENLFQAALKHGIKRLVFSSTMEVHVGVDWRGTGNAVLDETMPPRPNWIYPASKLMIEELGHMYVRSDRLEVVQMRYMGFDARSMDELNLWLLCRWLTADDVASANLLAATKPGLRDEVFNIGPETSLTQQDSFNAITDPWGVLEKHWPGCSVFIRKLGLEPKPDHFWPITRIDKAKNMLGWQPQSSFEKYLRKHGWKR